MSNTPLKRILLVEDEPDIQAVAQLALEAVGGFTVAICASGSEALAAAPKFAPDLILLDVMMPGIDGPTTLKALRELPVTAATPVIFMTAKIQAQEVASYKQLGALEVIPKPFDPMTLSKTISAIWEGRQVPEAKAIQDRFSQLLSEYIAGLGSKIERVEAAWQQVVHTAWNSETAQRLYRQIHSLAGSGATFGFANISDNARVLELLIKVLIERAAAPSAEQRAQIDTYLAALKQACYDATRHPTTQRHQAAAHDSELSREGLQQAASAKRGDNRLIYLAADDAELAQDLVLQIGFFGYTVDHFTNLTRLADALQQTIPAALLIDAMQITYADAALMDELRQSPATPPIIVLSASDDLATRLQAVRAGGDAFFTIPINIGGLIDKLDSLTERLEPEPFRILIIDDEVDLSEYYALTLRQANMIVETIADPLQIMSALVEFRPDLMLMDMYMPDCNGLDLAALIRQQEAYVGIPIVFLSTEANLDMQLEAMHFGGDDFLTKPIQPDQLISAISSHVRRSQTIRSLMVRDSLTGLLKHTVIKERLAIEVARAQRQDARLVFAMIDIDHFKSVNDTYGHATGDRVIKSLARLLQQRLRKSDVIGRYGGEEFAVILPDTPGSAARKVLGELREGFARIRQMSGGTAFYTTFSCGIAEYPCYGDDARLIDAADRALYEAKRAGRNRVVLAD